MLERSVSACHLGVSLHETVVERLLVPHVCDAVHHESNDPHQHPGDQHEGDQQRHLHRVAIVGGLIAAAAAASTVLGAGTARVARVAVAVRLFGGRVERAVAVGVAEAVLSDGALLSTHRQYSKQSKATMSDLNITNIEAIIVHFHTQDKCNGLACVRLTVGHPW
jgi:hypothetical protein